MRAVSIQDTETLRAHGLYVTPGTLRVWKCHGKYVKEGLFLKIGNRLFVDLDAWNRILEKEQRRMIQQGKKMAEAKDFKRHKKFNRQEVEQ